jgi:beta-lactamase regulating signal transducer with metallopeptidase domain
MNINSNNLIRTVFDGELIDRTGLTLIHSLWQIAAIVAAFAVIRMFFQRRKNSSAAIYWSGMVTLILAILAPAVTFVAVGPRAESAAVALTLPQQTRNELATELVRGSSESRFLLLPSASDSEAVAVKPADIGRNSASSGFAPLLWKVADKLPPSSLFWLAITWIVGAFLFSFRTVFGWLHVQHLRTTCSTKLSQPVKDAAKRALQLFPVSGKINFAVSRYIDVPTVVGIFRPVVLFPVSVLTELSQEQLELIIVHELAHVRRNDLLFNLVQTVIESILFFHPCIWWVSTIVRAERENCCDDAAVNQGTPASYARALLCLENARPAPQLSMAANSGDLLNRVRRIAGSANPNAALSPKLIGLICLLIAVGLLFSANVDQLSAQESDSDYSSTKVTRDFAKTSLGKVLDSEMDKLQQVGFSGSVLVAHQGEIILARSEGFSDALKKRKT